MRTTVNAALTAKGIEALKPQPNRYEVKDAAAPGLQLRVTPNGVKTFRWAVRDGGAQRWITLGRFSPTPMPGHITLTQARDWLERLKEAHRAGRLAELEAELGVKHAKPATPKASPFDMTVAESAGIFMAYLEKNRERPEQARRTMDKDILPALGSNPIRKVETAHCSAVVQAVVARGSTRQAGVVLQVMKQFFQWAWRVGHIESDPTAKILGGDLGCENNECDRFLSDEEIPQFWRALDAYRGLTPTIRLGLRFLLLVGCRSGELLKARVDQVDFEAKTFTVPVEHQKLTKEQKKTAKPWIVPLAPMALEIAADLASLARSLISPNLMASFHAKTQGDAIEDKALIHAMRRMFEGKAPLLKFAEPRPTPHDLRRTLRTGLGNLTDPQIPLEVKERCLNHSISKIVRIYDQGDYLEARREALTRWEARVAKLVGLVQAGL